MSEACTGYLRLGGSLLVNTSHGDVELARHDPRLSLAGVVIRRGDSYRVRTDGLDRCLVPEDPAVATLDRARVSQRGVAYTRRAAGYLFMRTT